MKLIDLFFSLCDKHLDKVKISKEDRPVCILDKIPSGTIGISDILIDIEIHLIFQLDNILSTFHHHYIRIDILNLTLNIISNSYLLQQKLCLADYGGVQPRKSCYS